MKSIHFKQYQEIKNIPAFTCIINILNARILRESQKVPGLKIYSFVNGLTRRTLANKLRKIFGPPKSSSAEELQKENSFLNGSETNQRG